MFHDFKSNKMTPFWLPYLDGLISQIHTHSHAFGATMTRVERSSRPLRLAGLNFSPLGPFVKVNGQDPEPQVAPGDQAFTLHGSCCLQ